MVSGTGLKFIFVTIISVFCFFIFICVTLAVSAQSEHPKAIDPAVAVRWTELLQRTPYAYRKPLPAEIRSAVDGTFVKFDPKPYPHVPCRRCPDYVPEGGIWKLQFDRGVMRIFYAETGWRSISSFELKGDRLLLFNDPHCTDTVGTYRWTLHEGQLTFELIEDPCAVHMRGKNLTKQPWESCQPPNEESAVTAHWPAPPGCD